MSIKNKQIKMVSMVNYEIYVILGTQRKVDFQGLTSGTTYYIAAVTFNTAGPGDFSNVIDVIAP